MPPTARMLQLAGETWVITCEANRQKQQRLIDIGCKVWQVDEDSGRVDLQRAFSLLAQQHINTVWVEAGATLNGALLDTELVDEWLIYVAPCVLGDQARGLFHFPELQHMVDKKQFGFKAVRQVGPDLRLTLSRS
jgi:diaminohydroxyphosphoribosylaminopyrimidine deaminase/5-amino-6-(5-phosphoribosylamino)uracil reductase